MVLQHRTLAIAVAIALVTCAARGDERLFRGRVVPILESKCIRRHGGEKPKGGLSLVPAKLLRRGGESGPVVVPGKPDESMLVDYISGEKPEMPKDGKPLSPVEVAAIREWIQEGAAWPDGLELT